MSLSFLPRHIYPSLTAVDPARLASDGVRLLMLDFDNTIVPYTTNDPTDEMHAWLKQAAESEIRICGSGSLSREKGALPGIHEPLFK